MAAYTVRNTLPIALLTLAATLSPRPSGADPIRNTLTRTVPYDYGWAEHLVTPPMGRGHAAYNDELSWAGGYFLCTSEVYAYSGLLQVNYGNVVIEAEIGATGFECIKSGWYSLTASMLLNGMVAISVPDPADWLGGSEAHARLAFRLRVAEEAYPNVFICNQEFNVVQLDDDHTGNPVIHWFNSQPLTRTSTGIALVAGKTYRASLHLKLNSSVGCNGLTAGGHAACVFSPHQLNLLDGGQYFINGAVLLNALTLADENPDLIPPTTVFTPAFTLNPCNPPVAGYLTATDNAGGYGVDKIYWRYAPLGSWSVYDGRDFFQLGDLWLEFHAVDRAGNTESTKSFRFDFYPETPPLPPLAPREPAPPLLQPVLARWLECPSSSSYRVQIADDPGFASPLVSLTVDNPLAVLPALTPGATYHWRIASFHDSCQNWSLPGYAGTFSVAGGPARARVFGDPELLHHTVVAIPYPNHDVKGLAAGNSHALMIGPEGQIVTFGTLLPELFEVPAPNSGFVQVSAGHDFSAALRADGSLAAWGQDQFGQCDIPEPNSGFSQVSCGGRHVLALRSNALVACWGDNSDGQCNPSTPLPLRAVAAGLSHSLALVQGSSGQVVAWGSNSYGQCNVSAPNSGFVAIAAGGHHSLALRENGSIAAWGSNVHGQCNVPEPNNGFVAIAAGLAWSLALRSDGSIAAWGQNQAGILDIPEPNAGYFEIAAGGVWNCALQAWDGVTAVDPGASDAPPLALGIARVTPNPFNLGTTLWLDVPRTDHLTLRVFDLRGRLVRTLWQGSLAPGQHPISWDGRDETGRPVAKGVYLARLTPASPGWETRKLMLTD